jgi:hypothetical protein
MPLTAAEQTFANTATVMGEAERKCNAQMSRLQVALGGARHMG